MENSVDPTTLLRKYKLSLITDNILSENEKKICNYLNNTLTGLNIVIDTDNRVIKLYAHNKATYKIIYEEDKVILMSPELKILYFYQYSISFGLQHSQTEILFSEWLSYLYLDNIHISRIRYL